MTTREFLYRLFFTRNDDLDTLQVLFTVLVVASLVIIWKLAVPTTPPEVLVAGLETLRWMMGLLVVTAVPKWLIPIIMNTPTPEVTEDEG